MRLRTRYLVLSAALATVPSPLLGQDQGSQPGPAIEHQSSFLRTLAGDFKHLFSTDDLRVAGIFAPAALSVMRWDAAATREMHELPSGAFRSGNITGGLWTQVGFAAGTMVVGKTLRQPTVAALGSELLR